MSPRALIDRRSSSQSFIAVSRIVLCFAHDDLVTASVYFELFQRARRWPTNILAVEVVVTVMSGAPDMFRFGLKLAIQSRFVQAGGKSFDLPEPCAHKIHGFPPEFKIF